MITKLTLTVLLAFAMISFWLSAAAEQPATAPTPILVELLRVCLSRGEREASIPKHLGNLRRENAAGTQFRQFSVPEAKLPPSFARGLPTGLWCTPMGNVMGTTYMSASRSSGSSTRKPIRWMAPALIKPRSTSAACAALKSASTIILRAHISSGGPRRLRVVSTTGSPPEIK